MNLLFVKRGILALTGARLLGGNSTPNNGLYADQEASELIFLCSLSQLPLPIIVIIIFFLLDCPMTLFPKQRP